MNKNKNVINTFKSYFFLILSVICLSIFSQAQQMFFHLLPGFIDPFTWVGLGGDANWNTGANWYGGIAPGAGNTAIFDNSCLANCDPTLNAAITVGGVNIKSTYAGTITQTNTITIGSAGWTQAAGIFAPSAHAITINGPFALSGGTYTATNQTWTQRSHLTISGAPTFNHNSGSLLISATPLTITPSNVVFNTVTMNSCGAMNTLVGLWIISGDLNLANSCGGTNGLDGGTIAASGHVTATNSGSGGSTLIRIVGAGNQTIIGNSGAAFPNLQILSTGGTVTYSGILTLTGSYTYTSGTIDVGTSTLQFVTAGQAIAPGGLDYNNITFAFCGAISTLTGTLNVAGLLHFNNSCGGTNSLNGGTIVAKGDVTAGNQGIGGTVLLKIAGTTNQTLTGVASATWPNLEIISTGGTVSFAGTLTIASTYLFTSGTVDAGASTLTFVTAGQSITPGVVNHFNITFNFCGGISTLTGTLNVLGTLSFATTACGGTYSLNGGAILASGNATAINAGTQGNVSLNFSGNTNTTVTRTGTASFPTGAVSVGKGVANSVSLTTNVPWNSAGQGLTISTGTLNVAGFALTVNSALTIGATGKLICNGGTATAGSWFIAGEISCGTGQGISWTGLNGNNNWNTAGNWSNNTIPGASDVALFNGNCAGAACNANINAVISVRGINLLSTYTGTLTQLAGNGITLGTAGWNQAAGTFVGGDSAITLNGPYALSGGAFTSTSGNLQINSHFTVSGAPTFTANSGTTTFYNSATTTNLTPGTIGFNAVNIVGNASTFTLTGTMTVNGTLTIGDIHPVSGSINTGTVDAKGDVVVNNYGYNGTGLLRLSSAGAQTFTGGGTNGRLLNVQIAAGAGTVNLAGTITLHKNFTNTSGTVNAGASTLYFYNNDAVSTLTPGAAIYNNVTFAGFSSDFTVNGTMIVNGTLTLADTYIGSAAYLGTINTGTLEARGDVILGGSGYMGSGLIKLATGGTQTFTGTGTTARVLHTQINAAGTVNLVGTIFLAGNFTYTSGTLDPGTSTLYFYNNDTVATLNPGAAIYNNVTFAGFSSDFTVNGTMIVNGTLTLADTYIGSPIYDGTINTGTIEARGDVILGGGGYTGTALLKIAGGGVQTFTGAGANARVFRTEIASTGTVNLAGVIAFYKNYVYTSGTIVPGASTMYFYNYNATSTITPGAPSYNNVSIIGFASTFNIIGTLNVDGVLTLDDTYNIGIQVINTGTIVVQGNFIVNNYGFGGTATISAGGPVSSTMTVAASAKIPGGTITIAKTGGASLLLGSDLVVTTGQSVTVAGGTFNLNGFDLTNVNTLQVDATTVLRCSGGIFASISLVNNGTMNCPGYAAYDFNWTGAGGNTNWNTALNWQGGVVPTVSDIAYFDPAYCGGTCDAVFNVNPNARGISTTATYAGTITQSPGISVSIGRFGWNHQNGTFAGGNSNMIITGGLTVAAGSFTLPSVTTTLGEIRCGAKNILIFTGGSLVHNNGRLKIAHQRGGGSCNSVANISFPNGFTVYDFETEGQAVPGWSNVMMPLNGTLLNVLNNYYDYGHRAEFDIDLSGNLFVNRNNPFSTARHIRLMGAGTQQYTYTPGSEVTNKIKIEKASGVVEPAPGNNNLATYAFELAQGSFTAPPAVFTVGASFSGTLSANIFNVASGQTYNHNSGTTRFAYSRVPFGTGHATGTITVPAGFDFYNVEVFGEASSGGWYTTNSSGGLTLNVLNNFTHTGAVLNSNWTVQGNVVVGYNTDGGTGSITLNGTGAQSLTAYPGSLPAGGTWTINKSSGVVTMYGTGLALATAGQDLNLVAGTINLNEAVLSVKDQFNISSGATVNCNNGFYTYGTLNNSGTISCGGTSYVKTVLSDNPKAYYRLGEPSASYKAGSSAAGSLYPANVLNSGGLTFGVNRVTTSITDKGVTTASTGVYEFPTPIPLTATHTYETWFKAPLPASGDGWNTLFRALGSAPSGNHHIIVQVSTSRLGVYDNIGGTAFRDSGFSMNTLTGTWHHLVAIGNGANTTFYIDKVNVGSVPVKSTQSISHMGNYLGGSQAFGTFDDVAIYDYALSQAQIDAHYDAGAPVQSPVVWMEDALPAGATPVVDNDSWTWVGANPAPNTGTLAHKSNLVAGMHQHYFTGATAFPIYIGDNFYIDIFINPTNPPTEIMVQLNDGTSWEHRVFWGADSLPWGTLGTNSRRYKGVIPATGSWIRLTFSAAEVGMTSLSLRGVAFSLYDGQVTWDQFGVMR